MSHHIEVAMAIVLMISLATPTDCLTMYIAKYGMQFIGSDDLEFTERDKKDLDMNCAITLEYIYHRKNVTYKIRTEVKLIINKLHEG